MNHSARVGLFVVVLAVSLTVCWSTSLTFAGRSQASAVTLPTDEGHARAGPLMPELTSDVNDPVTPSSGDSHSASLTMPAQDRVGGSYAMALDASSGILAVVDNATGVLSLFRGSTSLANLVVGADPTGLAFDDQLGSLFVAIGGSDEIVSVNLSSFSAGQAVAVDGPPTQIELDESTGDLWYSTEGSPIIDVINASTGSFEWDLTLPGPPAGFSLDAANDTLWAAIPSENEVSLSNLSSGLNYANESVAGGDEEITTDPDDGSAYVANSTNDTLTDISLTPLKWPTISVTTDNLSAPVEALAYSSASGTVDVLLEAAGQLELLNSSSFWDESGFSVPVNVTDFIPSGVNDTLYLGSPASGEILVDSLTTPRIVDRLGSGEFYWGAGWLTYDPDNGILYATIWDQSKLAALDIATNSVEATLPVGEFVAGTTLVPEHGLLVVADGGGSTLNLINTTTNQELTNVSNSQASWLLDPLYDPDTGTLFVTDDILNSVFVYCWTGATFAECHDVAIESILNAELLTGYLALDSSTQQLFVTEQAASEVTAIDATTFQVIENISVGPDPGVPAYDPANGLVYVPSSALPEITVINGSTDKVVATLATPCVSVMAEYDPGSRNVYDLCEYNHIVVLDSKTDSVQSWFLSFPCDTNNLEYSGPGLALDDAAQEAFVSDADVTCEASGLDMTELALPGLTLNGTLGASPRVGSVTANRTSDDVGQLVTFDATLDLRASGVGFVWSGLPPGCAGNTESLSCRPSAPGDYSISLTAESSTGFSATSVALAYTVYSDPRATSPTPTWRSADVGQTVEFLANVFGGSGGGAFVWTYGPGLQCDPSRGSVLNCSAMLAGKWNVSYIWSDSNRVVASGDTDLPFEVYANPLVTLDVNPDSLSVGSVLNLSAVVSGGAAPFSYSYVGLPPWCPSQNASELSCVSTSSGTYLVTLTVTDSDGSSIVCSTEFSVGNLTTEPHPPPPSPGTPPAPSPVGPSYDLYYAVGGAVGGLVGLLAVVVLKRRRS